MICCPANNKKCQYKVSKEGKLTAIVIINPDAKKGEDAEVTYELADYTDGKSLRIALCDALRKAGYVQCEEDNDTSAVARGIHATYDGTTSVVCLTGEAVIVRFMIGDVECPVEVLCNPVKVNKIEFGCPLGTETININGTDVAVADLPDAATAIVIDGAEITNVEAETLSFIKLTFHIIGDDTLVVVDGKVGQWCGCYTTWVGDADEAKAK